MERIAIAAALGLTSLVLAADSAAQPHADQGRSADFAARGLDLTAPLPTDPSLVTGRLENGLRYIVRRNANPPGRAVVWLHMHTGSLNETDRQRGLAHYLEHMAFNGSANFEPGSLVPFFQSLGMQFGRDQNAFTSFDQTTYQLSLPDAQSETLDKAFMFFSDVAGRLLLLPTEIDAERQIIQEERRRGLSGRQRTMFYVLEHIAPGSLYGERITIGAEETIDSVNEADFRDYYGKWYGAGNATLMVVGDLDPQVAIERLTHHFGSLPATPERPAWQELNVRAYDHSFAIVASDPEIRAEQITIVRLEPARPATHTVGQYRDDLVAAIGSMAMNRRLSEKVARGGVNYLNARVSTGNDSQAIYTAEMTGRAAPGKWKEALAEMALEWQRARAFGFSDREIQDATRELISSAERAVETEPTLPSQTIIGRLNGDVTRTEPTMSARQRLDLLNQLLPTITREEIGARFAREFDPSALAFIATLPASAEIPTESDLVALGTAAMAVTPDPDVEVATATTLMEETPAPGAVETGIMHEPTQVWSGWLSNGVRVHHRFMDERKNEATVTIDLIGGELLETAANRGITSAATLAWSRAATQRLTSNDIRALMTGRKVSVRGGGFFGGRGGRGGSSSAGDSISLTISGSPAELETGFQLAYLLLTEPRIEAATFDQYKLTTRDSLLESLTNPMGVGSRTASSVAYPQDDARVQPLEVQQLDRLTLEDAQAWLENLIRQSPIEVVIVGDLSREQALDLAARYLGALPPRERVSENSYADLRALERPRGSRSISKDIKTETAQAYVMSAFYGADQKNVHDTRAMALAARILSTRMVREVREEAQLVYSIGATSRAASTYPGFGVFSAAAPTEPSKADALVRKLEEMFTAFAAAGPTEEELAVAKLQFATTFQQEVREPGFWLSRLQQLTFRGADLDDILAQDEAIQSMTAEDVRSTFAKYYTDDNTFTVVVKPEGEKTVD